jgi:hypothetical protein
MFALPYSHYKLSLQIFPMVPPLSRDPHDSVVHWRNEDGRIHLYHELSELAVGCQNDHFWGIFCPECICPASKSGIDFQMGHNQKSKFCGQVHPAQPKKRLFCTVSDIITKLKKCSSARRTTIWRSFEI